MACTNNEDQAPSLTTTDNSWTQICNFPVAEGASGYVRFVIFAASPAGVTGFWAQTAAFKRLPGNNAQPVGTGLLDVVPAQKDLSAATWDTRVTAAEEHIYVEVRGALSTTIHWFMDGQAYNISHDQG